MRQPGTAPRGTFVCGCGARVSVSVTDPGTCIAQAETGARCRIVPVRESAIGYSLSLCADHLAGYETVLDTIKEAEAARQIVARALDIQFNEGRAAREAEAAADASRAARYADQSVVYYIRIGELVKIGTTTNMTERMTSLVPDEILATEPGDVALERMRHKQFAADRVRGERFRMSAELGSHIAMIREHFGEPKMTGYLPAVTAQLASSG